ncbi:zinc-binding dehydrogenase [Treponema socranskii]|uniref:zinc-binding dehydrogenase n=1 Tax=Treponema socranskii TaxID=53419 RepID=UPI003D6E24C1
MNTMKAVVLTEPTAAKDIVLTDVPVPAVKSGWVLVKIHAFGLNHSEQILRQFEIEHDYIQKPIIPGIECVGEIADASDTHFSAGQKVVALMGGMGRSFNGSYAEYALLPFHHVFAIQSDMAWSDIAAVPETYFTAWGSLFRCLRLQKDDELLIRGGTCALGYASIQIGKALGCRVAATTHRESKLSLLKSTGADECILDDGNLNEKYQGRFNKVLELVGCKTLRDTLRCTASGGIVCNTGVLGGVFALENFAPIQEIPSGVYLTGFHSNFPTQADIDSIFNFLTEHKLNPLVGEKFAFRDIAKACEACDGGKVNGKIVVEL